jgi:hypothetical protein
VCSIRGAERHQSWRREGWNSGGPPTSDARETVARLIVADLSRADHLRSLSDARCSGERSCLGEVPPTAKLVGRSFAAVPRPFATPIDLAAQWTGALKSAAFFAYADNYLIDVKFGIIMDVEATRAIRQAEVGAAKTMIDRTEECFDIKPERLAADAAYGSARNLNWLVNDKQIAPHIPVIDKSKREDGTFSREDFTFYKEGNVYICPAFNLLTTTGKVMNDDQLLYRASKPNCDACSFKMRCCPKEPARKICAASMRRPRRGACNCQDRGL